MYIMQETESPLFLFYISGGFGADLSSKSRPDYSSEALQRKLPTGFEGISANTSKREGRMLG